jgi:hypothetical protein
MAASTVCQSIADIYRERYGISMAVVRNVPMKHRVAAGTQGSDTINKALKAVRKERKILLYQGAVNVGRGIEAIMEAMNRKEYPAEDVYDNVDDMFKALGVKV